MPCFLLYGLPVTRFLTTITNCYEVDLDISIAFFLLKNENPLCRSSSPYQVPWKHTTQARYPSLKSSMDSQDKQEIIQKRKAGEKKTKRPRTT